MMSKIPNKHEVNYHGMVYQYDVVPIPVADKTMFVGRVAIVPRGHMVFDDEVSKPPVITMAYAEPGQAYDEAHRVMNRVSRIGENVSWANWKKK